MERFFKEKTSSRRVQNDIKWLLDFLETFAFDRSNCIDRSMALHVVTGRPIESNWLSIVGLIKTDCGPVSPMSHSSVDQAELRRVSGSSLICISGFALETVKIDIELRFRA